MRACLLALLTAVVLAAASSGVHARIQDDFVCWVPDCEFPVDCDDEE